MPLSGTETTLILPDMGWSNRMNYKIVTAFNESILQQNASKLLESFKNNWQPTIEFHCYYYD